MPMGRLAMHCATMPLFGSYILTDDGMDLAAPQHPQTPLVFTSTDDLLKQLDENAAILRSALTAATTGHLESFSRSQLSHDVF